VRSGSSTTSRVRLTAGRIERVGGERRNPGRREHGKRRANRVVDLLDLGEERIEVSGECMQGAPKRQVTFRPQQPMRGAKKSIAPCVPGPGKRRRTDRLPGLVLGALLENVEILSVQVQPVPCAARDLPHDSETF
jgi:hypothetical protein